ASATARTQGNTRAKAATGLDDNVLVEEDASALGIAIVSSIAIRASPISRRRMRGSLVRHRRKRSRSRDGVLAGNASQSASFMMTCAIVSDAVSPENIVRPVNIS